MTRGRLIFWKWAVIARYNGAAVSDAGDFDRSLREILVDNANTATSQRVVPRQESLVMLKAQVETDAYQRLQMGGLGPVPTSRLALVFFGPELEQKGFVDSVTKTPLLKTTDRLAALLEQNQKLILKVDDPPGLYAEQVMPTGFGFGHGGYNLVEVMFSARPPGTTSGGGVGGL